MSKKRIYLHTTFFQTPHLTIKSLPKFVTENQNIWINQLKQGNELAALNIYNSYSKAMYNTLIRITNNQEASKDLLQEAFVKAFKKIQDLDNPNAFAGWLKRIVVNTGIEYVRRREFQFEEITNETEELEDEVENDELIEPETLHHAIKELPDGCRMVLSLHLLEGYKHSEVAQELGISESTSKTQYRHAKMLLKEKLQYLYAS